MALLVKDANTTTQSLATGADSSGNLVPVHVPAILAAGVATPVSTVTPLPVINSASSPADRWEWHWCKLGAARKACSAG